MGQVIILYRLKLSMEIRKAQCLIAKNIVSKSSFDGYFKENGFGL